MDILGGKCYNAHKRRFFIALHVCGPHATIEVLDVHICRQYATSSAFHCWIKSVFLPTLECVVAVYSHKAVCFDFFTKINYVSTSSKWLELKCRVTVFFIEVRSVKES